MEKDTKIAAATGPKAPVGSVSPQAPQPRAMSLENAKELIRKTSAEHAELFRRLAE